MKTSILLLTIPFALMAQTTINGGRIFKGRLDASGAASTVPYRTGTGSPAGRDSCGQPGEAYFQVDAAAGTNLWVCTSSGAPGAWAQLAPVANNILDPGANGIVSRTASGTSVARTITAGSDLTVVNGDGVAGNPTISLNTAVALTNASAQANKPWYCNSINGSLALSCSLSAAAALTSYTSGMCLDVTSDTSSDGTTRPTINVDNLGVKSVTQNDGASTPAANMIRAGLLVRLCYDGTVFRLPPYTGIPFPATTHQFVTAIDYAGKATTAQPAASDVVGLAASATSDTTNASNIASGTLSPARLPAFTGGDATSSAGTVVLSVNKVNGVSYGSSPSTNTVPVVTAPSTVSYGLVPNAALVNSSVTINGSTVSLGESATVAAAPSGTAGGDLAGSYPNPAIAANAVTSSKMSVVNTRRVCSMIIGSDNGGQLTNADLGPQGRQCFIPAPATVIEITVAADGGTPNIIPRRSRAGTPANLVSSALATTASGGLACSNSSGTAGLDGTTLCSGTLQNIALNAGDWIELGSGTAGGAAKRMSVSVTYTIN
jgi:hypothetical protein